MPREPKIEFQDYPSVAERAEALDVQIPSQLALLPRNFESATTKDELVHESEVPTVRVLFRKEGIVETPIELPGEVIPQIAEHAFQDWVAPILFFSYSAFTENPALVNLSLGVISNYLTDLFKGLSAERGVKLDIVVENKEGTCKKVSYQGPLEGLKALPKIIKEVGMDE